MSRLVPTGRANRRWSDALKGFVLRFGDPWFPEEIGLPHVDPVASSWEWLVYCALLIPVAGLFKHLSEDYIEKTARAAAARAARVTQRERAQPSRTPELQENKGKKPIRGMELIPTLMNALVGWCVSSPVPEPHTRSPIQFSADRQLHGSLSVHHASRNAAYGAIQLRTEQMAVCSEPGFGAMSPLAHRAPP